MVRNKIKMKIRIKKKKIIDELSSVGGAGGGDITGHVNPRDKEDLDEVYSEKQRKYMCAMMNKPSDERPEGLSKKEAEEMCKDTEHSKKIDEMFSTSGAIMGSGSGQGPYERSPEGHKRYVRIRFTQQGLQNFKPNPHFRDAEQQLGEEWSKDERNKRKSKCSNPKGFTMKQFCKNQRTKSKKGEKKNENKN